jgi:hypothetical protein
LPKVPVIEPLQIVQVGLDVNRPLWPANLRILRLAARLDEVENGYGSEVPLPEDGGGVVGGKGFVGSVVPMIPE